MKSFTFELSEPVSYSSKGEVTQGTSITFYAPSAAQRKKVTKLKQFFFRALPKEIDAEVERDKTKNTEQAEITGEAIIALIAGSDADYSEFIELGRSLLCERNAKIDDIEFLTAPILDRISIDELENMVGQYVANFIVKSALMSLGKN